MEKVFAVEAVLRELPQLEVITEHVIHAGMYARTIRIPNGAVVTGSLVKIPTLLVVHGDADLLTGDGWTSIRGFCVLPGSAHRKQILVALSAVEVTMVFPTQAKTVEEAEREFTDEGSKLVSRSSTVDTILVTGE